MHLFVKCKHLKNVGSFVIPVSFSLSPSPHLSQLCRGVCVSKHIYTYTHISMLAYVYTQIYMYMCLSLSLYKTSQPSKSSYPSGCMGQLGDRMGFLWPAASVPPPAQAHGLYPQTHRHPAVLLRAHTVGESLVEASVSGLRLGLALQGCKGSANPYPSERTDPSLQHAATAQVLSAPTSGPAEQNANE